MISLNHYEKPKDMISLLDNASAKELSPKDEEESQKDAESNFNLM